MRTKTVLQSLRGLQTDVVQEDLRLDQVSWTINLLLQPFLLFIPGFETYAVEVELTWLCVVSLCFPLFHSVSPECVIVR